MFNEKISKLFFAVIPILALFAAGCDKTESEKTEEVSQTSHQDGHTHGGWWCTEHAIPEDECSMCSSKVAAEFQAKGDWCEEHNRADSQCFICHPENAEKYAAIFEAKEGKKPPAAIE